MRLRWRQNKIECHIGSLPQLHPFRDSPQWAAKWASKLVATSIGIAVVVAVAAAVVAAHELDFSFNSRWPHDAQLSALNQAVVVWRPLDCYRWAS